MSSFSQYLFQRHFGNSGFLTKTQTNNFGVSGTDIKKADKNEILTYLWFILVHF